jgi:hypothetical protein
MKGGNRYLVMNKNGVLVKALVDTGAEISCIKSSIVELFKVQRQIGEEVEVNTAVERNCRTIGTVYLNIQWFGLIKFHIFEFLNVDIIIGNDVWARMEITININKNMLELNGVQLHLVQDENLIGTRQILKIDNVQVSPPMQEEFLSNDKLDELKEEGAEENEEWEKLDKEEVENMIQKYFQKNKLALGKTKFQHKIRIFDNTIPIKQKPRRVPHQYMKQLKDMVEDMLKQEVIRNSTSPWASPVVLVPKKDGSVRLCIDYRKVNEVTVKDPFPLAHIEDIIYNLEGAKVFSGLDLNAGYWQIPLEESSKEVSAFITPWGQFEFNRMPFGLCNAASSFTRMMDEVFHDFIGKFIYVYIDDILIFSKSIQEHKEHINKVFQRLKEFNLSIKLEKCKFCRSSTEFLGHVIGKDGIKPSEAKVETIKLKQNPVSKAELQSFLGLTNYYRRFIKNYAEVTAELYELLEKKRPFEWNQVHVEKFESLKKSLCEAPVLTFFNNDKEVHLHTDASAYAIGGILMQEERVVCYVSRKLKDAETRYAVIEKELLAIVWCIQVLKVYLLGRRFTIWSDHEPLEKIKNIKDTYNRIGRWIMALQGYDFVIKYKRGVENENADAMSRFVGAVEADRYLWREIIPQEEEKDELLIGLSIEELREHQLVDEEVRAIKRRLTDDYVVRDGLLMKILFRKGEDVRVVYFIPRRLRKLIVKQAHITVYGSHSGYNKTLENVLNTSYWPSISTDIHNWVGACYLCGIRKSGRTDYPIQYNKDNPGYAFQKVAMDILSGFPVSSKKNQYILVFVDLFSKFVIAVAIPDKEAKTIAWSFMLHVVAVHGLPEVIHCDQGTEFKNLIMKELTEVFKIKQTFSSVAHPQSNGNVERMNRTLSDVISFYTNRYKNDWDVFLPLITAAYNSSRHSVTKISPYAVLHGFAMRWPTSTLIEREVEMVFRDPINCAKEIRDKILDINERVLFTIDNIASNRLAEMKKYTGYKFELGELVFYKALDKSVKTGDKYRFRFEGPYKIVKILHEYNYVIKDVDSEQELVVHAARLKPYRDPNIFMPIEQLVQ